jgi:oxygen-independent coproporphyrinogen-3 oxidase
MVNLFDKSKDAEETIMNAHKLGLRVSIDLMYNLPGQTLEIWNKDIQRALELNVESVDCYVLDVYPDTKIAEQLQSGELPPRGNEDVERKMYTEAYTSFKNAGYKPTCHNRFSRIKEDFKEPCFETLGTGSGFFMGNLGDFSYTDIQPAESYVESIEKTIFPIAKLYFASKNDEMRKMMMRLYIRLPVDKEEFKKRFGILPEEAFTDAIQKLEKNKLIEVDDQEIKLTKLGDIWRYNICWEFSNNNKNESP